MRAPCLSTWGPWTQASRCPCCFCRALVSTALTKPMPELLCPAMSPPHPATLPGIVEPAFPTSLLAVLAANLLCRLPDPIAFLDRLPSLIKPGGVSERPPPPPLLPRAAALRVAALVWCCLWMPLVEGCCSAVPAAHSVALSRHIPGAGTGEPVQLVGGVDTAREVAGGLPRQGEACMQLVRRLLGCCLSRLLPPWLCATAVSSAMAHVCRPAMQCSRQMG